MCARVLEERRQLAADKANRQRGAKQRETARANLWKRKCIQWEREAIQWGARIRAAEERAGGLAIRVAEFVELRYGPDYQPGGVNRPHRSKGSGNHRVP